MHQQAQYEVHDPARRDRATMMCRRRPARGRVRSAVLLCVLTLLSACSALPPRDHLPVETALKADTSTRLGQGLAGPLAEHPGLTGIYALPEGKGALAARALLADAADRSLDIQYYIWHGDAAGILLWDALLRAAERGVRVRLLLDDNGVAGLDDWLASLDAHPKVEVRLVNPFMQRSARWWGYATDFGRLNHRMHNKSFTADSQVTIVGGRNIGNEYFAAGQDLSFADLDVVAVGSVVRDVTASFDDYWNSEAAYPLALIIDPEKHAPVDIAGATADLRSRPEVQAYVNELRESKVVGDLLQGHLPFEWTSAQLVYDDPRKLQGVDSGSEGLLLGQVEQIGGSPEREFLLVSPYFVPTKKGAESLAALAGQGVAVSVLTNSLAATDVAAVHGGYAKRRKALLRAGVRLFELKPVAESDLPDRQAGIGGSSGASLHAKTFAADGERIFVGSFNFDPRSAKLNTEMGLLIDSEVLAERLVVAFRDSIPLAAWEVLLTEDGKLEWLSRGSEGEQRTSREPEAGFMRRFTAGLARWLPIESQL